MRLLFLTLLLTGLALAAGRPESTDTSSANKISSTKPTANSIQSTPQKTSNQQTQGHYIPQYVVQKSPATTQSSHSPPAMYILAQPAALAVHGPAFQQAVHQLLNYYNTNPQAKYQLLQQQHPSFVQSGYQPASLPQNSLPTTYQQIPQNIHLPSGALHVIPSPQLNGIGHLTAAPLPANVQYALAVPAPGHIGLSPGLFAQIPQGLHAAPLPIHQAPIPAQIPIHSLGAQALLGHALSGHQALIPHPIPSIATHLVSSQSSRTQGSSTHSSSPHGTPISTTLSTSPSSSSTSSSSSSSHSLPQAQALTQSQPQISNHITAHQISSQFPMHYSNSPQLTQYQPHHQFSNSLPIGSIAPHGQFGLKSHVAGPLLSTNDYLSQTEKSVQSSSTNYNPIYRATYIKG